MSSNNSIGGDVVFTAPEKTAQKGKRHSKNYAGIVAAIVMLVLIIGGGVAAFMSAQAERNLAAMAEPYIGELYVTGTISSDTTASNSYQQKYLLNRIGSMENDPDNEGLLLYVDSPGGAVYEADELYLRIREYKENTGRPVYAYFAHYAASGGYYIAADADRIIANRNCTTGSIGVYIGPYISMEGLLDKLGVDVTIVKSSDNKAMGNGYEDLTEEQLAIIQSQVDLYYDRFVKIVAEGRGLDEDYVRQVADGRTYLAEQALEAGLIDEIGSLEDAEQAMADDMGGEHRFVTLKYKPKTTLESLISQLSEAADKSFGSLGKSELETAMEIIESNQDLTPSYLAPGLS